MGSEWIWPAALLLAWELAASVVLGIAYAAIFRRRNVSKVSRMILDVILKVFAVLLMFPTVIGVVLFFAALSAPFVMEPRPSLLFLAALGLTPVALVAAAWWGLLRLAMGLSRP